ncbi:hypothetical protein [Pseudonocardia hydrocarbonoxydans]|uniref:Uncharacterized protein n=1 Tax=Pseudonocardia hydrocarbonoxydans TaxID=76726 RepID=A0A4Y3WVB0_9PSEU|nr:hypothetical protein [Pseudonocardia hydrocarbonoxydans]GEC22020.1 hypothetical protein PHY01_43030 [Pseudonocardia hydrocarbonoxydans]
MRATLWADLRFVARADALQFCLRNNIAPTRNLRRAAVLLTVVGVVVAVPAAGLLAGFVLAVLGLSLPVGADAVSGGVLLLAAGRALAVAVRGNAAGTRARVFAPPDVAVLRHFEISTAAVLAVRVAAPAVLSGVVGAVLTGSVLIGVGRGYGNPVSPVWLGCAVALAVVGSALAAAAAARPPVERPRRRWSALLGLLVAALLGWLAGRAGIAAAELLAVAGAPALITQVAGVGSAAAAAAGSPLAVVVPLVVAGGAVLTLRRGGAERWRAVLRPRAGSIDTGGHCRPIDLVTVAVRRGEQGGAALARRAGRVFSIVGAGLVGSGVAAPGRLDLAGSGVDGIAGGGVLLTIGLVLGGLVRAITGPAGWARQLRWTAERGVDRRALVVGYMLGSLRPLLPVVLVCVGLAMLAGDAAVLGFGVCAVLVTTASGLLGDLWQGGSQAGADGSTESTAAGAAVGIVVVAAGVVPWVVLSAPGSWIAGTVVALASMVAAAALLDRTVLA